MKLRAALAAVNTIDARDSDHDVTARRIILQAMVQDTTTAHSPPVAATAQTVDVNIYGYEPQPFITEVFVSNFDLPDPVSVLDHGRIIAPRARLSQLGNHSMSPGTRSSSSNGTGLAKGSGGAGRSPAVIARASSWAARSIRSTSEPSAGTAC